MKLLAFIKKDILVALSYRFRLLLGLGSSIISLLIFYFIGRTFSGAISPFLEPYGNDFFSYVLVVDGVLHVKILLVVLLTCQ